MSKAYCVADLGFGDSGKGTTTQWLVEKHNAELIVKYSGGCQAAHNVVDEIGRRFTFSQLGSTLRDDVPTYLWRNFIVDPIAMLNEAEGLKDFLGNGKDPLRNVYVHPDCPLVSLLDVDQNRSCEQNLSHGTCGRGIGKCRERSRSGWAVLRAKDANNIRPSIDPERSDNRDRILEWASRVHIQESPLEFKVAVFEGSQGILLDESVGFHPHTTWSTVRFDTAHACYRHLGIRDWENICVIRTYHTRHGAGPFPTERITNLTDPGNPTNEYQGPMRFGHFDKVLFDYAMANAGSFVSKLAITHCDEKFDNSYCCAYELPGGEYIDKLCSPACIEDQIELCNLLKVAKPIYRLGSGLEDYQNLPVLFRSYGPKLSDKESV